MSEFLSECFNSVNLPISALLVIMLAYWAMIMVGVFGFDAIDLDFDADLDLGVDADVGFSVDATGTPQAASTSFSGGSTTSGSDGAFRAVFEYFYLGEVPLVIIGSFFVFYLWILTVTLNHYFNAEQSWITALLFLVPNILVSLIAMRYTMIPFAMIFKKPPPESKTRDALLGMIGVVTTSEVTEDFGQVEVQRTNDVELRLNVRTKPGQRLGKGDAAKLISFDHAEGTFLVELAKWEKN